MRFTDLSSIIGDSEVRVSRLGIGMAPAGNLFSAVEDSTIDAMLAHADALAIPWFDTAPLYGHGLSEQRLGRYLRSAPHRPRTVSTKVGRVLVPDPDAVPPPHFVSPLPNRPVFDYSAKGLRESLSGSLDRLGLTRVDIALLHDVDRFNHPVGHRALAKHLVAEALPTLQALKREGLAGAIGLGINEWDIGYELLAAAPVDVVL